MSDYQYYKVLRVPFEKYKDNFSSYIHEEYKDDIRSSVEDTFKPFFEYGTVGKFMFAPTEEDYVDFVLEEEYGSGFGEFGKVRSLNSDEVDYAIKLFSLVIKNINADDIKLVEYCWYNCSEAPGYYSNDADEFYSSIRNDINYWVSDLLNK